MSNKYISMPPGLSFVGEDRKTKRTLDKHEKHFFFFFNVKRKKPSIYNTVKQIIKRRITTILDGGVGGHFLFYPWFCFRQSVTSLCHLN